MLIYPPYYKYRTPYIPYRYDAVNKKDIQGTKIDRNNKYWGKIYNKIDKLYISPTSTLPKHTKLYRCSLIANPLVFDKSFIGSNVIYFGLDFVISIWISLEIYDKDKNHKYNNFYLHVYELNKNIKYKYIKKDIGTIPELDSIASKNKVCVHPQLILHGNYSDEHNELGTEISFPRNSNFMEDLSYITTYKINVNLLNDNRNKLIYEWDPAKSLTKI